MNLFKLFRKKKKRTAPVSEFGLEQMAWIRYEQTDTSRDKRRTTEGIILDTAEKLYFHDNPMLIANRAMNIKAIAAARTKLGIKEDSGTNIRQTRALLAVT